jgi:hypothetical protein
MRVVGCSRVEVVSAQQNTVPQGGGGVGQGDLLVYSLFTSIAARIPAPYALALAQLM